MKPTMSETQREDDVDTGSIERFIRTILSDYQFHVEVYLGYPLL